MKETDFTIPGEKKTENYLSECQTDLAANNFKAAIVNMFKKVKETVSKEL